eukprot:193963-Prymnesium_polylepis.1
MAKAAETAAGGQAQRAAMKEAHRTHLQAVMQLIEKQEWEKLLDKDQLRGAQNTGDAFVGFNEGDSLFSPTFKVRRVEGIHYNPQRSAARRIGYLSCRRLTLALGIGTDSTYRT